MIDAVAVTQITIIRLKNVYFQIIENISWANEYLKSITMVTKQHLYIFFNSNINSFKVLNH